MTVIEDIKSNIQNIKQEDLDVIASNLVSFYDKKIDSSARFAYGYGSSLQKNVFKILAKDNIKNALNTFIFKKQHWKSDRPIEPYLLKCISRLSERIHSDTFDVSKKIIEPVCPACRDLGEIVFVIHDEKKFRCDNCFSKLNELNNKNYDLHKSFSLHSKIGYHCGEPDCDRFIPASLSVNDKIACPYPDCDFFGNISELDAYKHPVSVNYKKTISLNQELTGDTKTSFQDLLKDNNTSSDNKLILKQELKIKYDQIVSIINKQMELIEKRDANFALQKILMYKAIQETCDEYPEDMISYFAFNKSESTLQSYIYQKYINLIQDSLPCEIKRSGKKVEVFTINDPILNLFSGLSEFEAIVDLEGRIPNNTQEHYISTRRGLRDRGKCYIGKLIDVVDENNNSLLPFVKKYTFSKIFTKIEPGTRVYVSHYRIPAHYELGSLVILQSHKRTIMEKLSKLK